MRMVSDGPDRSRRPAVAIGYQGFGNVGDEAILSGIEALLAGGPVAVRAVIAGDRAPVVAFGRARRITSRRLLPSLRAAREIRRARLLLFAGGGLIHDHWPIVIPRYVLWTLLARAMGARICWVGVGVGPIGARWARLLSRIAIGLACTVTVRDEESARWIRRVAPGAEVAVVPDPAVFVQPPPPASGGGTALIVRRPVPADAATAPRLADAVAALADARLRAGRAVDILTMEQGHDDAFAAAIAAEARSRSGRSPTVRALPLETPAALAALARYDEAISVRLHGLLLCALARTPCVPIVYDAKVAAAAAQLGLGEVAVPIDVVSADALEAGLGQVREPALQKAVAAAVEGLRRQRQAVAALIEGRAGA